MILVADASALIALATCDGLLWLDKLFGEVIVPEAVSLIHAVLAMAGEQ